MLIANHVVGVVILCLVVGHKTGHIGWNDTDPSWWEGVTHVVVERGLVVWDGAGRDLHLVV